MKKKLDFPMALDINENKVNIDNSFSTLHDITGVFYDECYSPIWSKTENLDTENIIFDKKGNRFEIKDGALYKNDTVITSITNSSFEKSDWEPHSNVFDVKNDKEAYVTVSGLNIPTIHYNGTDTTGSQPLFTNGTIVHSRCKIINNVPVYVSIFLDDNGLAKVYTLTPTFENTHTFTWRANRYASSSNHPVPSFRTASEEQKVLYEPIIFISNYNDDILVTVTNNSGQPMKTTDFYTDSYIIHNNTYIDTLSFSTSSIPVVVTVTENITVTPSYSNTFVTSTGLPAYSNDNGTTFYEAKDTASTPITFDAGYVPTEVADDGTWKTYNYVKTDTTFTMNVTGDGNLHDIVGTVNFAGSSAPKQDTATFNITEGTGGTYVYSYNGTAPVSGATLSMSFDYYNSSQTSAQKTTVTIPQDRLNYNYTFTNTYTTSASATTGVNPNVFNDYGTMWCLFEAELDTKATTSNSYSIPFECGITNITYSGTTATISYSVTKEGHFDNTYCVYRGASISLGQNWCREIVTFSSKTGTELAQNTTVVNAMDEMFDSGADAVKYSSGVLTSSSNYYEKEYSGSTEISVTANAVPYSNVGSRVPLNSQWNIVYANNLRVGLSYSGGVKVMGTLVSEWNDVHTDTYVVADGANLYYEKADRSFVKISIVSNNTMKLVENKYLVINTTSYWNCYDIEKNKLYHYATDYTNRCIAGTTSKHNMPFFSGRIGISTTTNTTTAVNANYLVTNDGISSVSIGPSPYSRLYKGSEDFIASVVPSNGEKIDVYYGTGGNTALYVYSYIVGAYNKVRTINPDLISIAYPLATGAYTLYSPNIFTEYLVTYNNRDAVINGGLAYQLIFANNTTPIMLYSTATQLENVQAIFVIQSQFYGIIDDKIYALLYNNGTLMEADCIIDITGMQYLGGLPTIAYFYSPMNRSFYSFTGDANLALLYETTDIHQVYMTRYNTGTQTLYICTDKGLFLISSTCMTRLDIYNVEEIYFTDKGWVAIKSTDSEHLTHTMTYVSYYSREGYKPIRMAFETKLFGGNDKENVSIRKYYVTLLNHGYTDSDTVTYRTMSLTDVGHVTVKDNSKPINPGDWDIMNQYQFEIVPDRTKGQGIALWVESPWAIASVVAEVEKDGSTAISKPNKITI